MNGENFSAGFFSVAFGKATSQASTLLDMIGGSGKFTAVGIDFGELAIAAIAGGAGSKMGGGSFTKGVHTASLANLFNSQGIGKKMANYISNNEPDGQMPLGGVNYPQQQNPIEGEMSIGMGGAWGAGLAGMSHDVSFQFNTTGQFCKVVSHCGKFGAVLGIAGGPVGSISLDPSDLAPGARLYSSSAFIDFIPGVGLSGALSQNGTSFGGARFGKMYGAGVQACRTDVVKCM
ncbi:hypothetical protein [Photobacterium lutimaris]|uniref:hypothetical protein n=1 Tax=Photobacterium lutimaris TaxID=388278 RepID=UPI00105DD575|nr:hypothetical protein [Photobacterium lutimaris]